jgi:hypothetical protein
MKTLYEITSGASDKTTPQERGGAEQCGKMRKSEVSRQAQTGRFRTGPIRFSGLGAPTGPAPGVWEKTARIARTACPPGPAFEASQASDAAPPVGNRT